MKKLVLIGALSLGLMSFNETLITPGEEECMSWAEQVEQDYSDDGCNTDVFNMAYGLCMTNVWW